MFLRCNFKERISKIYGIYKHNHIPAINTGMRKIEKKRIMKITNLA